MPVQEVVESRVSVDEHVLLGCFGLDLAAVRQKKQLHLAMRRAVTPRHSPHSSSGTARSLSAKLATATGCGDGTNARADLGRDAGRDGSYRWLLWSTGDGLNELPPASPPTPGPVADRGGDPSTCPLRGTLRPHPHPELTTPRKATAMSPQPTTATPQPVPYFPLDPPHEHTASCFWDLAQCRWQCGPLAAAAPTTPRSSSIPGSAAEPWSTKPISPDR